MYVGRSADNLEKMGNLQGSDKKQKEGKGSKGGGLLTKTKKSPVKDLFKHQVVGGAGAAGGKKTPALTKPPEDPVSVTRSGGGNDRERGTSCGVIVTDSWRRVGALQQQSLEQPLAAVSPETSSSDSVFTDPLVSVEPDLARREEDDVTLTMETSDEESTPLAVKRRLDSLDEEVERDSPSRTKSLDKLEAKTFTVVRHRKVELPPSKLSEQCLISAGNSLFISLLFLSNLPQCVFSIPLE